MNRLIKTLLFILIILLGIIMFIYAEYDDSPGGQLLGVIVIIIAVVGIVKIKKKTHHMHLNTLPFNLIKKEIQQIEVRLNDEKRKKLKVGDQIEFTSRDSKEEKFRVEIIDLIKKDSFDELYSLYTPEIFGGKDKEDLITSVYKYYSKEDEKKYGVLGIKVRLEK